MIPWTTSISRDRTDLRREGLRAVGGGVISGGFSSGPKADEDGARFPVGFLYSWGSGAVFDLLCVARYLSLKRLFGRGWSDYVEM